MEENIQLANARLNTNLVIAAKNPEPHLVRGTVSLNILHAKLAVLILVSHILYHHRHLVLVEQLNVMILALEELGTNVENQGYHSAATALTTPTLTTPTPTPLPPLPSILQVAPAHLQAVAPAAVEEVHLAIGVIKQLMTLKDVIIQHIVKQQPLAVTMNMIDQPEVYMKKLQDVL